MASGRQNRVMKARFVRESLKADVSLVHSQYSVQSTFSSKKKLVEFRLTMI